MLHAPLKPLENSGNLTINSSVQKNSDSKRMNQNSDTKNQINNKKLNYNHKKVELLSVYPEEWDVADIYFINNPEETKMPKNANFGRDHSFIRIKNHQGVIDTYAIANKDLEEEAKLACLGKGGYGKVKVGQNRKNENRAVKVLNIGKNQKEMSEKLKSIQNEINILTDLNAYYGSTTRIVEYSWLGNGNYTGNQSLKAFKAGDTKVYIGLSLVPGKNIKKVIKENNLSLLIKYKIALQMALCVQELHDMGILHGDIKGENYMVEKDLSVLPIDFGLAIKFDPSSKDIFTYTEMGGTKGYIAPELQNCDDLDKAPFSVYSDIFALGKTFEMDLNLEPELYKNMISGDNQESAVLRTSLKETINLLSSKIEDLEKAQSKENKFRKKN